MTPSELTEFIHSHLGGMLKMVEGHMMGDLLEQRLMAESGDFFRMLEVNREVDHWRVTVCTGAHSMWFTWEVVLDFLDIVIEGSSGNGSFAARQIARSPTPITPPLPLPGPQPMPSLLSQTPQIRPNDFLALVKQFLEREKKTWITGVRVDEDRSPWDTRFTLIRDPDNTRDVPIPPTFTGRDLDAFLESLRAAANELQPKEHRDAEVARALIVFERDFD